MDIFKRAGWNNEILRQQIQGFKKTNQQQQNFTYIPKIHKDPKRTYITDFTTFPNNNTRRYSLDIGVHYDLDIAQCAIKYANLPLHFHNFLLCLF